MILQRFVVVDRNGRTRPVLYSSLGAAKRGAKSDGDSIVEVEVNLGRPPLFIRGQILVPPE